MTTSALPERFPIPAAPLVEHCRMPLPGIGAAPIDFMHIPSEIHGPRDPEIRDPLGVTSVEVEQQPEWVAWMGAVLVSITVLAVVAVVFVQGFRLAEALVF